MKKVILILTSAIALVLASTAAAALVPGVYVQNAADAGCVSSTYSGGALPAHYEGQSALAWRSVPAARSAPSGV